MILRPHQKRFLEENPNYALLCHEMRTGKSLIGELWIKKPERSYNAIIVCLKKNKKEWIERCPDAAVFTKEEFKKFYKDIQHPTGIVVDEAHHFFSPVMQARKRSDFTTALYTLLKNNPECHVLLLTATPITNNPASIHTALAFIGLYMDWKKFQDHMYELKRMPFIPRPAWFPQKDWREKANALLNKHADIVSLKDCVDVLPAEIVEIIEVKTPPKKYEIDEEQTWTKDHRQEQILKPKKILELGHRKMIVVAHYTEQIDDLEKKFSKNRPTYVLDGRTKDQAQVIADAQKEDDCFLIVQAAMGEAWDGYMFDAMVIASMPHTVRFHTQMRGRLTTIEKEFMKPLMFYYMHGGVWDKKIYKSVMAGEDWNPHKHVARVT